MKFQTRKLIPATLTWLLIAAMLLVSLPLCVAAEGTLDREPSIKDSLLIQYDFEGDTLEDQLSDKAGDVKTNLNVIPYKPISLDSNGKVNEAIDLNTTDETELATLAKLTSTVDATTGNTYIGCSTAKSFALTTDVTSDTQTMVSSESGTWYLRVNVTGYTGVWEVLMSMRDIKNANRFFGLEVDGEGIHLSIWDGNSKTNTVPLGWMDIAVTRSGPVNGTRTFTFWAYLQDAESGEYEWTALFTKTDSNTVSPEGLVMSLFGTVQHATAVQGNHHYQKYDEIRYYSTILTPDELDTVRAEVVGETAPTVATPDVTLIGMQRSLNNTGDNTYSVRLIAQIKAGCEGAGFYVTANNGTEQRIAVTNAYTSILEELDGGIQKAKTAETGYYLIALTISGIPADTADELTFAVTPYIKEAGVETEGRASSFLLKNGLIQSATWVD